MSVLSCVTLCCAFTADSYSTCQAKVVYCLICMPMTDLEVCSSTWCFIFFRKLLKTCNIEVSLESTYAIIWELCVRPAVGALDDGWVDLFPVGKSVKAVRAEGMMTSKELGLVGVVIIGLLTDATELKLLWGTGVWMKTGHECKRLQNWKKRRIIRHCEDQRYAALYLGQRPCTSFGQQDKCLDNHF